MAERKFTVCCVCGQPTIAHHYVRIVFLAAEKNKKGVHDESDKQEFACLEHGSEMFNHVDECEFGYELRWNPKKTIVVPTPVGVKPFALGLREHRVTDKEGGKAAVDEWVKEATEEKILLPSPSQAPDADYARFLKSTGRLDEYREWQAKHAKRVG